jgi:hypothetical protein
MVGAGMVRERRAEEKRWKREGGKFEKAWLERLKPFDGQELHPKSRDLLDKFITLSTMVEVASMKGR